MKLMPTEIKIGRQSKRNLFTYAQGLAEIAESIAKHNSKKISVDPIAKTVNQDSIHEIRQALDDNIFERYQGITTIPKLRGLIEGLNPKAAAVLKSIVSHISELLGWKETNSKTINTRKAILTALKDKRTKLQVRSKYSPIHKDPRHVVTNTFEVKIKPENKKPLLIEFTLRSENNSWQPETIKIESLSGIGPEQIFFSGLLAQPNLDAEYKELCEVLEEKVVPPIYEQLIKPILKPAA